MKLEHTESKSTMSAFKDSQQSITFVYSNLYQIYRKGKAAKGVVLNPRSLTETPAAAEVKVASPQQNEGLRRWAHADHIQMASHLLALRDARKRLNYLMTELDELLKRS